MEVQLTIANIITGTQQQAQNGQSKGNQSLELYSLVKEEDNSWSPLCPRQCLSSAFRVDLMNCVKLRIILYKFEDG